MGSTDCLGPDDVIAFVDGQAADLDRDHTDHHLDRCSGCRAVVLAAGDRSPSDERELGAAFEGRIPPAPTFRPGAILAGRYRIERLIGRGGMGEVYVADDVQLGTRIALKTVNGWIAHRPRMGASIKREVLLARQVTHPAVCRVFDFGVHDDVAFLTMELLRGETLGARLRRTGALSAETALVIAEDLIGALEAAHAAGVIHRDFKSDNVILVEREAGYLRAVVTDFGLARAQANRFATASDAHESTPDCLIGTLSYMAPEQIDGRAITPATDIYALGVVLFEMVTGRLPFAGSSTIDGALKRLSERPVRPSTLVAGLAPSWDATILRCLEREASDRFPRLGDVRSALAGQRAVATTGPYIRPLLTAAALAIVAFTIGRSISSRSRSQRQPIPVHPLEHASAAQADPRPQPVVTAGLAMTPAPNEVRPQQRDTRVRHAQRPAKELLVEGPPSPGTVQTRTGPLPMSSDDLLDPRDDDLINPYQPEESR